MSWEISSCEGCPNLGKNWWSQEKSKPIPHKDLDLNVQSSVYQQANGGTHHHISYDGILLSNEMEQVINSCYHVGGKKEEKKKSNKGA